MHQHSLEHRQEADDMSKILYHGTTARRWAAMQEADAILPARIGVKVVSMTTKKTVAHYFANNSASVDKCEPVVLKIDAEALKRDGFALEKFSDPVWGKGKCDWECEVICETQIPLRYVTQCK